MLTRSTPSPTRRSRPRTPLALPWPFVLLALVGALGTLIPLGYLVLRALEADPGEVRALLFRPRTFELLGNTLTLAAAVLLGASLLALPLAWLAARAARFRALFVLTGILPLAVPGYVAAYAFLGASGPNGFIAGLSGFAWPAPGGFWGAAGVLTLCNFPYLFLNFWAALRGADPALEESARLLGVSKAHTFWRLTLPSLRPAWLAGGLLVTLHVLGDFGTVSLMRFPTFSYAIYEQYNAFFDRTYAAWLALVLLALIGVLVALEARLIGRIRLERSSPGSARRLERVGLGVWTLPALAFAAVVAGTAVLVPLASLVFWLLRGVPDAGAWLASLGGSLWLALPAALLAPLLALAPAYLGVRFPSMLTRVLERLGYLAYATPPLAFALALVLFSLSLAPALYQTVPLLVFAYGLHFLAEALGPLRSSLLLASSRVEDAARTLGLPPVRAFVRATLPLLRPGLLAGAALVFVSVLKELPLAYLLTPIGFDTLAKDAFSYSSEAMFAEAAPYALSLVAVSLLFVRLLWRGER